MEYGAWSTKVASDSMCGGRDSFGSGGYIDSLGGSSIVDPIKLRLPGFSSSFSPGSCMKLRCVRTEEEAKDKRPHVCGEYHSRTVGAPLLTSL